MVFWGIFWEGSGVRAVTDMVGKVGCKLSKCSKKFLCDTFGAAKLAFSALRVDIIERG